MSDQPPTEPRDAQRPSRLPGRPGRPESGWPRWATWVLVALVLSLSLLAPLFPSKTGTKITYSQFLDRVRAGKVEQVDIDNNTNAISGEDKDGDRFKVNGPDTTPDDDLKVLDRSGVKYDFKTPQPNLLFSILPYLLP